MALALLTGCGGGGSSNSDTAAAATTKKIDSGITKATLHRVGDTKASGSVVAVGTPKSTTMLKIRIQGLKPAIGETMYAVWQLSSRHDMTAIGVYRVRGDRRLYEDVNAPNSFTYLEDGTKEDILITRVYSDDRWRDALLEAKDPYDPPFIGSPILRGTFRGPLVGSKEAE